jgi:hypothetical protein
MTEARRFPLTDPPARNFQISVLAQSGVASRAGLQAASVGTPISVFRSISRQRNKRLYEVSFDVEC